MRDGLHALLDIFHVARQLKALRDALQRAS